MDDFERIYKEKVIDLGKEALKNIIEAKPRVRTSTLDKNFIIEYARKGKNYFSEDNKIRLMVVGRAAGVFGKEEGKHAKYDFSILTNNNGSWRIDKKKIEECFEIYSEDPLNWIHADSDGVKGKRFVDSKPFFRFAKTVYLRLTEQEQDFEWYRNICHSNIYKIISPIGGNPTWATIKRQERKMSEIMKEEFEFFKPTHILVIDGEGNEHCWCKEIKEKLSEYAENVGAKICFCNRPEVSKRVDLLETVDRDFNIK